MSVARGFQNYKVPFVDLVQEGNLGLLKAVHRFDHERGVAVYPDGKEAEILPESQDVLSAFYYVRTLPLSGGAVIEVPGGTAVLAAAAICPDRVAGVAVVEPVLFEPPEPGSDADSFAGSRLFAERALKRRRLSQENEQLRQQLNRSLEEARRSLQREQQAARQNEQQTNQQQQASRERGRRALERLRQAFGRHDDARVEGFASPPGFRSQVGDAWRAYLALHAALAADDAAFAWSAADLDRWHFPAGDGQCTGAGRHGRDVQP